MALVFNCPSCAFRLEFADEAAGMVVNCPKCKARLKAPSPRPLASPAVTPAGPAPSASSSMPAPPLATPVTAPSRQQGNPQAPKTLPVLQAPDLSLPPRQPSVLQTPLRASYFSEQGVVFGIFALAIAGTLSLYPMILFPVGLQIALAFDCVSLTLAYRAKGAAKGIAQGLSVCALVITFLFGVAGWYQMLQYQNRLNDALRFLQDTSQR